MTDIGANPTPTNSPSPVSIVTGLKRMWPTTRPSSSATSEIVALPFRRRASTRSASTAPPNARSLTIRIAGMSSGFSHRMIIFADIFFSLVVIDERRQSRAPAFHFGNIANVACAELLRQISLFHGPGNVIPDQTSDDHVDRRQRGADINSYH